MVQVRQLTLCCVLLVSSPFGGSCHRTGRHGQQKRCEDVYSAPREQPEQKKRTFEDFTLEGVPALHLRDDTKLQIPNYIKTFPVHGQGTVVFDIVRSTPFSIIVRQIDHPGQFIGVEVRDKAAQLVMQNADGTTTILKETADQYSGFDVGRKISYWLSYDRFLLRVKYGKGYRMEETTILEHDFLSGLTEEEQAAKRSELFDYFNPVTRKVIEQYDVTPKEEMIQLYAANGEDSSLIDVEGDVEFDLNPFVANLPAFVRDDTPISLYTIEDANYIFPHSLSQAAQELYYNIYDTDIDWLEEVDGFKLSDAIRYSMETENCTLYEKLKSKVGEFGDSDPNGTYLRVTLGTNYYNSPGVPYVLELWPKGHYSPIHNHGNAHAVIKVLFGHITVHIYNKQALTDGATAHDQEELLHVEAHAGDFTWLNPRWYQTHKLYNHGDDYCATIQCYQYAVEDTRHWPYFDYAADQGDIDEFYPSSDFVFSEMREIVMAEYSTKHCEHGM